MQRTRELIRARSQGTCARPFSYATLTHCSALERHDWSGQQGLQELRCTSGSLSVECRSRRCHDSLCAFRSSIFQQLLHTFCRAVCLGVKTIRHCSSPLFLELAKSYTRLERSVSMNV